MKNQYLDSEIINAKKYYHFYGCNGIWKIIEKNFLDDFLDSKIDQLEVLVGECLARRRAIVECLNYDEDYISGDFLKLHPSEVMYDCLAEEYSGGLFDSNDVPPPELWIGYSEGELISFIPRDLYLKANSGVIHCVSGSLEWS